MGEKLSTVNQNHEDNEQNPKEAKPNRAVPHAPVGRNFTLREVCDELSLGPHTVRQLLDDFSDVVQVDMVGGEKVLSESDLARLRTINDLRRQGFDTATILDEVQGQGDLTTQPRDLPSLQELLAEVFSRLDVLDERTRALEERLIDDRDKFLLNILKLQKEIQHLRYELVSSKSRRERRKGLFN